MKIFKWKKNRNGIEYYYNGKLRFKGEYLNGSRIGKRKEYHIKGEYLYNHRFKDIYYINEKLE